jgi:hypothetical protein
MGHGFHGYVSHNQREAFMICYDYGNILVYYDIMVINMILLLILIYYYDNPLII